MSDDFIKSEIKILQEHIQSADIVITTALIPGKTAPKLLTLNMINSMKQGSIVIDLAAKSGGNCVLTIPDKLHVTSSGVKIIGYTDLPNKVAAQSSELYSSNLVNLMQLLYCVDNNSLNLKDIIIESMMITHKGKITWSPNKSIPVKKPLVLKHQKEK